jgi:uncharacterized repeat protein (TIGR03803 family)
MNKLNWMTKACGVFLLWVMGAFALPAQTFTTLYNFDIADGAFPLGALVQGADGNLYGTTTQGGANDEGTVFEITPSGTLTTLHSFNGTDGSWPVGALVQAPNGGFYGATEYGGSSDNCEEGCGTVFKITPSGTLTTLHSFDETDGALPEAGLTQAADGDFYGTTAAGGVNGLNGYGTVFKITQGGTLTTLHNFCSLSDCEDGYLPSGGLVQSANGALYGTTEEGGNSSEGCPGGCGTVFSITTSGVLTTLNTFDGTDGNQPYAGLVQATNGDFYGTALEGGSNTNTSCADFSCGTVFKITPSGALTALYDFCSLSNCADGDNPYAGLVQATDGHLYGTTYGGGANGNEGTLFTITPSGELTTLYSFAYPGTYEPFAPLIQDTNGILYGTTLYGASTGYGNGTVFSLSVSLGQFVKTNPTSGKVGATVKILGTFLTGATSVTFNGTPAGFTINSKSEITTTVPAGATSGTVQVITPRSGTLSSNMPFRVAP